MTPRSVFGRGSVCVCVATNRLRDCLKALEMSLSSSFKDSTKVSINQSDAFHHTFCAFQHMNALISGSLGLCSSSFLGQRVVYYDVL